MPEDGTRMRELLGAEPPPGLAALDPDDQAAFAELLIDARRHQAQGLERAFTEALRHVPFPVRKIVKKVLLG
jgi:hypothetical protein